MLIPVLWTDCECFKKITDCRGRLVGSLIWTSGWTALLTHRPSVGVCMCVMCFSVAVCVQKVVMIGGNDSFVHIRLKNVFVWVDIDLSDTNTLSVFFIVNKWQEIGYIRTHRVPVGCKDILNANYMRLRSHTHAESGSMRRAPSQEPLNSPPSLHVKQWKPYWKNTLT